MSSKKQNLRRSLRQKRLDAFTRRGVAVAMAGALVLAGLPSCSASRATRSARKRTKIACNNLKDCKEQRGNLGSQLASAKEGMVSAHQHLETSRQENRQLREEFHSSLERERARSQVAEAGTAALSAELARSQALTREALQEAIAAQQDLVSLQDRNRTLERLARTPPTPAPTYVAPPAPSTANLGPSPEAVAFQRDLESGLARQGVNDLPVEVRSDEYGERVAVVLPDAFRSGKADLHENDRAVQAIVGLGRLIQESYPGASVLVEGHTDSDPIVHSSWGTNERLSLERAGAVRQLLASTGVSGSSVSTQGLGATRPLDPGSSREAKSRNRRVEIYIKPNA